MAREAVTGERAAPRSSVCRRGHIRVAADTRILAVTNDARLAVHRSRDSVALAAPKLVVARRRILRVATLARLRARGAVADEALALLNERFVATHIAAMQDLEGGIVGLGLRIVAQLRVTCRAFGGFAFALMARDAGVHGRDHRLVGLFQSLHVAVTVNAFVAFCDVSLMGKLQIARLVLKHELELLVFRELLFELFRRFVGLCFMAGHADIAIRHAGAVFGLRVRMANLARHFLLDVRHVGEMDLAIPSRDKGKHHAACEEHRAQSGDDFQ